MIVGVPTEHAPGEHRVGLTPDAVQRLAQRDLTVLVEPGAGAGASLPDDAYREAGAEIAPAPTTSSPVPTSSCGSGGSRPLRSPRCDRERCWSATSGRSRIRSSSRRSRAPASPASHREAGDSRARERLDQLRVRERAEVADQHRARSQGGDLGGLDPPDPHDDVGTGVDVFGAGRRSRRRPRGRRRRGATRPPRRPARGAPSGRAGRGAAPHPASVRRDARRGRAQWGHRRSSRATPPPP